VIKVGRPEGLPFIAGAWFLAVPAWFALAGDGAWVVVAIWVIAFFRDPVATAAGDNLGSRCGWRHREHRDDGRTRVRAARTTRISIFMNVLTST
jgi:hypothetical protein